MGLIGRWFDRLHPTPETPSHSTPETRAEASRAIGRATRDLAIVEERKPVVDAVVDRQRWHGIENHLGELVEVTMRGVG